MSRPIKLTKEYIEQATESFREKLSKAKLEDGTLSYSQKFKYEDKERATITYTESAYTKMQALIMGFDTEVAWHGVGERTSDNSFVINDIVVYPQTVGSTDVDFDTDDYNKWMSDNLFEPWMDNIILQGHSHVNMATSPSPTDLKSQGIYLEKLRDDGFYIFLIANKRGDANHKIYDLKNNVLYEKDDIDVVVEGQDTLMDFMKNAKEIVNERSYYASKSSSKTNKSTATETKPSTTSNNKLVELKEKPKSKSYADWYDDDDDIYGEGYKYGYCGYGYD